MTENRPSMANLNLDDAQKYCVFQSEESWFGIPCLSVRSIIPRPSVTRMPFSDPVLKGVSHIQNEFMPIFSLRSLFNVQYEANDAEQQLMIFCGTPSPWGLLIDRAVGLAELEPSYSAAATNEEQHWSKVVVGSASWSNHVLQVLDPEAILSYALKLMDSYWSDATRLQVETVH